MGAIRALINSADDSDNLVKEQNSHLDTLAALAQTKVDLYVEQITERVINAGQGTDKTIPITQIQDFISETHAYLSSNADKISDTVSGAIKGFVQGGKDNITNGVCSLLTGAVTALFGSTESNDMEFKKYYVVLEGISLVRLDVMGWKRAISASSLTTKVEQVSAFVVCKSTVDIKKTDFNTFLDLYQEIIKAENPDAKTADIISNAKTLYKDFQDSVA